MRDGFFYDVNHPVILTLLSVVSNTSCSSSLLLKKIVFPLVGDISSVEFN